jgi:hypothetical protein
LLGGFKVGCVPPHDAAPKNSRIRKRVEDWPRRIWIVPLSIPPSERQYSGTKVTDSIKQGFPARGRGRPPKFGRAAQLVALTLPRDVVEWLQRIHPDLACAIVSLFERTASRPVRELPTAPEVELLHVSERSALIVVDARTFVDLPNVSTIPLSDGRAFLALNPGSGMADLELTVTDRLEELRTDSPERERLVAFQQQLRAWRRDPALRFQSRSIIVVQSRPQPRRRKAKPLAAAEIGDRV